MQRDPLFPLAMNMSANPGVYALLLGSGVSRSSGISTGWEITLDLVRRLALLDGVDKVDNLEDWYKNKFGESPEYSKILETLAPTQSERQGLLRTYFEPTDDERSQSIKVPQEAHRAIAELVRSGFVKLIITTNFDRLLELALQDAGITPTVISTSDGMAGSVPLVHGGCVIVKINGDYLDTRILNTETELSKYDQLADEFLDRVFDEYGLIICGWSADWDIALSAAIERAPNRRYSTYWCHRGELTDVAQRLCNARGGFKIPIEDADSLFAALNSNVKTLTEIGAKSPLEEDVLIANAKRLLSDPTGAIGLHDLTVEAVEVMMDRLDRTEFPVDVEYSSEEFADRVSAVERITRPINRLGATYGQWLPIERAETLQFVVQRLSSIPGPQSGKIIWLHLELYPVVLFMYSMGINAIAYGRYDLLRSLLITPIRTHQDTSTIAGVALNKTVLGDLRIWRSLPGLDRHQTPRSERIRQAVDNFIPISAPTGTDPEMFFDKYEYLSSLNFEYEENSANGHPARWLPWGRFLGRGGGGMGGRGEVMDALSEEARSLGESWGPITAGFFGGQFSNFEQTLQITNEYWNEHGPSLLWG